VSRGHKEGAGTYSASDGLWEAAYGDWRRENARIADILLVLSWTGLRWSEVREVRVDDLMRVPTPGLMIRRAAPEGVGTKSTKGRRSRRVPLANRVLPLVLAMAEGKEPGDLLFTTAGGSQLHRTATARAVNWSAACAFSPVSRRIRHSRFQASGIRNVCSMCWSPSFRR